MCFLAFARHFIQQFMLTVLVIIYTTKKIDQQTLNVNSPMFGCAG